MISKKLSSHVYFCPQPLKISIIDINICTKPLGIIVVYQFFSHLNSLNEENETSWRSSSFFHKCNTFIKITTGSSG